MVTTNVHGKANSIKFLLLCGSNFVVPMYLRLLCTIWIVMMTTSAAWSQADAGDVPIVRQPRQKKLVLFPVLVHSPEYLWGAGVAGTYFFRLWHDSTTRTSNLKNVTFYTLRHQFIFANQGTIYFPHEKYIFHFIASYSHFPDRFWGLGNETPSSNMEEYEITQYNIHPELLRKVVSDFYVGISYEYQNVFNFKYNKDGSSLFDTENITGRNGGHISGAGLLLTWDSRNNAFSPSKGFFMQYSVCYYYDFLGSDFNFILRNLDVRKYFDLKKNRVLAFQFNLISTVGNTPIRDLASIGSGTYMRGYYDGRYADFHMVAFQGEYRFPVYKRWGLTTFAGIGRVGDHLKDVFSADGLKPSVGIGIRYSLRPAEKLNLRIDFAAGKESQGSYVNIGEAF